MDQSIQEFAAASFAEVFKRLSDDQLVSIAAEPFFSAMSERDRVAA